MQIQAFPLNLSRDYGDLICSRVFFHVVFGELVKPDSLASIKLRDKLIPKDTLPEIEFPQVKLSLSSCK